MNEYTSKLCTQKIVSAYSFAFINIENEIISENS